MSKKQNKAAIDVKTEDEAPVEQQVKKVAVKQAEKAPAKTNLSRVYLGPTIPGTSLERYKVFKGELHGSIAKLTDKIPAIKRLIVETKELATVEQKIGDKTTVFAHAFAEIINHIKKGDQR